MKNIFPKAKFFLALIILALNAKSSFASQDMATAFFNQANAAYEYGDYATAETMYRKAVDEGVANSKLFYNYANTLFRLHKLGPAIQYYEKGLKLSPEDEDIQYNLKFANAQTIDKNPILENNFFTKVLWLIHSAYSIAQGLWAILLLFSSIFLFAAMALFLPAKLKPLGYGLMVLSIFSILLLIPSLWVKIDQQESAKYAIVLKPTAEMFSGPGDNYQVLTKVHEGTKFEIINITGEWVSVKLLSGKGGFVKAADLGKV